MKSRSLAQILIVAAGFAFVCHAPAWGNSVDDSMIFRSSRLRHRRPVSGTPYVGESAGHSIAGASARAFLTIGGMSAVFAGSPYDYVKRYELIGRLSYGPNGYLYGMVGNGGSEGVVKLNSSYPFSETGRNFSANFKVINDIYVDALSNVFVVGSTTSQTQTGIRIEKYDPNLVLVSSVETSYAIADDGYAVVGDSSGNIYVGGGSTSGGTGGTKIWLGKYSSGLVLLSSASISTSKVGLIIGFNKSDLGYLYACGYQEPTLSTEAIWIGKVDHSLNLVKEVTYPSSHNVDAAEAIDADTSGNIFAVGERYAGGGSNVWLAKYDQDLILVSSRTFSGYPLGEDIGLDVISAEGRIFVAGTVGYSESGTTSTGDMFMTELTSGLVQLSSMTVNGTANEGDAAITLAQDGKGGLFVGGFTSDLPVGPAGPTRVGWLSKHALLPPIINQSNGTITNEVKSYPQPFRPSHGGVMTISNLPPEAKATLYTLSGEKIAELTANSVGDAPWRGINEDGKAVASGVYLCVYEVDGTKKTFKIAVQR